MKKLLTFAAIALVAVAAQAAQVTWTSGAMFIAADKDGTWATANTDKAKNGLATAQYLIVDSDTYDTYAGNGEKMYNDWGTLTKTFTGNKNSGVISSNGGAASNWVDPTEYTKADGDVYALALFKHSSVDYGDFYIAAAGSGFVNDDQAFEGTYGNLASNNKPWVKVPSSPIDVPEPTSLALIALGVAAFGLKRKHA